MIRILCVVGARPNFIKIAAIMRALGESRVFEPVLVHTGQHYDEALSQVFFDELDIPRPDIELEVGSGSHAGQTATIMQKFEPVLADRQPCGVLVVGDVNSTIACAQVTAKFHRREPFWFQGRMRTRPAVIHVEAGLRSFDHDMPEEINRRLTDAISDLLYVSDPAGLENLKREGAPGDSVHYVGNVMIDTLLTARDRAMRSTVLDRLGIAEGHYGLVTLHRPSNVDDPKMLGALLEVLGEIADEVPLLFPAHPRTRQRIDNAGITPASGLELIDPVGYLDFVKLMSGARIVFSDSGGIQEETTILGVPCLTLRENTERPVTLSDGTNRLVGTSADAIRSAAREALSKKAPGGIPKFWDGNSGARIVAHMETAFTAPEADFAADTGAAGNSDKESIRSA